MLEWKKGRVINMQSYFQIHQHKYPNRQIQDDIKWLFQSILGCEHFVLDFDQSLERIKSEMNGEYHYFIEDINDKFARFHFENLTETQAIVLNQLFIASSQVQVSTKEELKKVLEEYKSTRTIDDQLFIQNYIDSGMNPISHSDYFKSFYNPHYRVIYKHYLVFFDLLCDVYEKGFKVLAIDGRCGSGKSTLGKLISDIYNCPLIHMDDFYLPQAMRTVERLSEPGGNVHRERFKKEIYEAIENNQDLHYGIFTHKVMDVEYYVDVPKSKQYVIEGSYAFHPDLRDYIDYKVFLTQSPKQQKERIIKRNGEHIWEMFETRWIPLEETYFNYYHLEDIADYVVDVTDDD